MTITKTYKHFQCVTLVSRTLGINMCEDTQKFSKLWSSMPFSAAAETDTQHFWKATKYRLLE
jgi:hypothetical protein